MDRGSQQAIVHGVAKNQTCLSTAQRRLEGYCLWGLKESDTTEATQQQCSSLGFPDSSVGKESACNAGDPGLIPGLGRSTGEGINYPLQYSWASLVAQLVKNMPAMRDTWVRSLGWEDSLEKGTATHSRRIGHD